MRTKFVKAFGDIQELFQELLSDEKISDHQAERFDQAQKVIVNYHTWVINQLEGNLKVDLPWDDPEFTEAWKLWKRYKTQQHNFTYKPIGEEGALKDLADLSGGNLKVAIAIIHQSIKKGWKGFFAMKQPEVRQQEVSTSYKQSVFNRLTNR